MISKGRKMKLLSLELAGKVFDGFVEDDGIYRRFSVYEDDRVEFDETFPAKNYSDLDHFIGVIGKFDPYVFFFKKPIEIKSLKHATLHQIHEGMGD